LHDYTSADVGQMNVTVTRASTCNDQGGVVIMTGVCKGRKVSFVVEPRQAGDLAEEVAANGEAIAVVEDWQITSQ